MLDRDKKDITLNESGDVIAKILADRKAKNASGALQLQTTVITNGTFFTDNNPMGWMTKQQFKDVVLDGLTQSELNDLKIVLEKLSNGEPVDYKPLPWQRHGKSWYFVTFSYKKGSQKFKIPAIGVQTNTFLTFYQSGTIILQDVSLEGLLDIVVS